MQRRPSLLKVMHGGLIHQRAEKFLRVAPQPHLLHLAVAGDSRDDEVQRVVAVVY